MNEKPAYEPFDPAYLRDLRHSVFGPIFEHYFRPRLLGAGRLPSKGPAILAANHSGNAFPWDGLVLDGLLWMKEGMRPEAKCRSVFEKELTVTWWMRPFGIDNFWRRGGGVDMTFDNFHRLMDRGDRVLYYPEGVPGIGKGFFRRYQLQRFSSSFVMVAARRRAPVCPIYIINAEWVVPFCFTWPWLDRWMQRLFRIPFLPLPAAPLGILFPWAWYLALPARLIFVVGEPIDVAARLEKAGVTDLERIDREVARSVAEEIRQEMQGELTRLVGRYGRHPYHWRSLRRELSKARGRRLRVLPLGWPVAFVRHDRDRRRPPAANRFHALLRDLDLIFFYLPFGWLFLALTRALRKPPYGFRGVSREESRRCQGQFHWHLRERPLPQRPMPQHPKGGGNEGAATAPSEEPSSS